MKKLLFSSVLVLLASTSVAFSAPELTPAQRYEQKYVINGNNSGMGGEESYTEAYKNELSAIEEANAKEKMTVASVKEDTGAKPLPDYFSQTNVPLTAHEQDTLQMAQTWAKTPHKPIQLPNGKVAFLHGASIPTIIASPFNLTDLEFEAGENIASVLLGDTARWTIETGAVGNIPHLFIKPLDTGLETSAVVTSNKRVYHLRLVSQRKGFMPYVGWLYPEASLAMLQKERAQAEKQKEYSTTVIDGQQVALSDLHFGYKINGSASWKPVQVYNDGVKTYIKLPAKVQEMPILLARSQGDVLVNYRIDNNTFVVDGLFDELVLVIGVGGKQERVRINKI